MVSIEFIRNGWMEDIAILSFVCFPDIILSS